ncbi:MAG: peptidoglycan DD-metalloendopeptidase family protein [Solirubrobacterales bacterium]
MAPHSRTRFGRRTVTLIAALATAGASLVAGSAASAGNGGASGGGVPAPKPPTVTDASCLDRCAGLREATAGATVKLAGRRLKYVDRVKFPSSDGGVTVKAADVSSRSVEAKVPEDAGDGKPRVLDEFGQIAKSPVKLQIVPESELPEPGSFRLAEASVTPEKSFFYGEGKPTLHYIFNGNGTTDVRVDLVAQKSGEVVNSWVQEGVEPNSEQTVEWNGVTEEGKSAKSGDYRFRVGGLGDSLSDGGEFGYFDHKFPIRGRHDYWDGIGAGRGHQGQDIGAGCGTELQAARGGKVQFKGYHGAAGNYLVIDGKKSRFDYVYMHLRKKAEVAQGEKVRTGERIGEVGETGNASGCHLHYEMWSAPGWYEGGHFVNPTKKLKKWDRWS